MKVRPLTIFLALCVACVLMVGGYIYYARQRGPVTADNAPASEPEPVETAPAGAPAASTVERAATNTAPSTPPAVPTSASSPVSGATPLSPRPAEPHRVFYRYTGVDAHYGMVAWSDTARPRE